MKIKIINLVVALVFFFGFTATPAYASTFSDNFNDGNANGWWLGYSQPTPLIGGNWRVEDIGLPHEGVLVQDNGADHFIALVENIQSSNQTIETQLKLNQVAGYGGVTIWFQDDNNWVNVFMYPAGGFIRIYENVNGTKTSYSYSQTSYNNPWYDLKVIANSVAGTLDVYLDNIYLFTYNVVTPNRSGLSGVNSGNSGGYFDNFTITSDSIAPTPTNHPTNKEQCKKNGWKAFTDPTFKNQGDCISYVEKHKKEDRKERKH